MNESKRIDSIDVFRGLTMFLMLFVNDMNDPDLGRIKGVPPWMEHMPGNVDGMTFVDVIWPAFLFSVGLCIPLALNKRLERGGLKHAFGHVLTRSLGLILIGLGMVNTYRFHPTAMPISPAWWEFLFFTAVILVWNRYPHRTRSWSNKLRIAGGVLLVILAIIYRGDEGGNVTWMRTSWWGILTLIGVAYLIASAAYLLLRKNLAGMIGVFVVLTVVNIGDRTGALPTLTYIHRYFSVGGLLGGLPSIAVAGAVAGMVLLDKLRAKEGHTAVCWLFGFAGILALCGLLLRPPFGISKLHETPAWCLLSTAISSASFAFLFWLVDVKRVMAWASFVHPVGAQPLLAYVLPHLIYPLLAMLGLLFLEDYLNTGLIGILRSLLMAVVIVGLTKLLTRLRVDLRL
jgi:heparan-alpha-glucosaminide N-acetyltransferase